jgi:hypothetical protein
LREWPEGAIDLLLPAPARIALKFADADGSPLSRDEALRRLGGDPKALEVLWVHESAFHPEDVIQAHFRASEVHTIPGRGEWDGDAFRLLDAPGDGRWRLLASWPADTPRLVTVSASAGGETAEPVLTLSAAPLERVRFVDAESGDPLGGAAVTPIFEHGDDQLFLRGPTRKADAHGEVLLPRRVPGRGEGRAPTWWVETDTHLGALAGWLIQEKSGEAQVHAVPRRAGVRGTAWLPGGDQAAGRRAHLVLLAGDGGSVLRATEVDTRPGEVVEVRIGEPRAASEGAVLEGRLTAGGSPLPGKYVHVTTAGGMQPGTEGALVQTDADGRWRHAGLPAGAVNLVVWLGNPQVSDDFSIGHRTEPGSRGLVLEAGRTTTLDFDLPGGAIEVTIVDEEGKPLPGAVAVATPEERGLEEGRFEGFRLRMGWSGTSDAQGKVRLVGLQPGARFKVLIGEIDPHWTVEETGVVAADARAPTPITLRRARK